MTSARVHGEKKKNNSVNYRFSKKGKKKESVINIFKNFFFYKSDFGVTCIIKQKRKKIISGYFHLVKRKKKKLIEFTNLAIIFFFSFK